MYQQVGKCPQQIKTKTHLKQVVCPMMDIIKCCIGRMLVQRSLLLFHQKFRITTAPHLSRALLMLAVCRIAAATLPVGIKGRSAWNWKNNHPPDAPATEAIYIPTQTQKSWWSGWRVLKITSHSP